LHEAGLDTVKQIKGMSVNKLMKLPGIGKVSAEKIYNVVKKLEV